MTITITEGDFDAFFQAPFACYGEDARTASPLRSDLQALLDSRRNPLLRDGHARLAWFTAFRDGRLVGRITAHVHDASNRLHGTRRGCFGFFDCIDDQQVANALLDAGARWLRERGCDEQAGNFNLTITQMIGVVTEGHTQAPYTYQDWSPPHIARLLEAAGFDHFYPMRTFQVDVAGVDPQALLGPRQRALLDDPDWTFQSGQRGRLRQQLRDCCTVLNDGFSDNPMFVPLSDDEFLFGCAGLTAVIDTHLTCIAYHRGEPAGAFLAIPDLGGFLHASGYRIGLSTPWHLLRLKLRRDRVACIYYSVAKRFHGQGVNAVMLQRVLSAMRDRGYRQLGISWISDSNGASLRQMEKLGGQPLHRLHLFRRRLS